MPRHVKDGKVVSSQRSELKVLMLPVDIPPAVREIVRRIRLALPRKASSEDRAAPLLFVAFAEIACLAPDMRDDFASRIPAAFKEFVADNVAAQERKTATKTPRTYDDQLAQKLRKQDLEQFGFIE